MIGVSESLPVILICGTTHMRKSIDGLCTIVVYELEQEPCSDCLFVFCGRTRNRLKIRKRH
ncbi:IS66 family insertion sequence element accessory protein TnpB [Marinomonas fungiae]|uniref:IS66 Orf2 like protein n=1 Tax=Marinomonas fungiae TaxID=1137284 RepID=A0A0K6IUT8_9GAMM|nr:IS66 family insertion sequence element accessory protein TnpB [Marinomonas fungiae]CUB06875.1 IS66 Orf2 like protein [Marinomonas fungiae]